MTAYQHQFKSSLIFTRRSFLSAALMCLAYSQLASAGNAIVNIEWLDLIPKKDGIPVHQFRAEGVVQHGQISAPFKQPTAKMLTSAFNGKRVRLSGYLVPLDFTEGKSKQFLLAPFAGACVHVPPPPANQLILISTDKPYTPRSASDPVIVVGTFHAILAANQLAETGYLMRSAVVKPYGF